MHSLTHSLIYCTDSSEALLGARPCNMLSMSGKDRDFALGGGVLNRDPHGLLCGRQGYGEMQWGRAGGGCKEDVGCRLKQGPQGT